MDAKAAADKIRDKMDPSLPAILARDEQLVSAVCRELGLADNPANRVQALLALKAEGISTRAEFPKVKYRQGAEAGKFDRTTVYKAEDEAALGTEWFDSEDEASAPADEAKGPSRKRKANEGAV